MPPTQPIQKVLVANRGEIALRIFRSLRRLGIAGVAVYHDADADAPHVEVADEAYELVGETPTAAYLDAAQILRIAVHCDADAVHPGYGFLAENADFAAASVAAGIKFVGPSAEVIRLMGDKVAAREFVATHGFALAPSVSTQDDGAELLEKARQIGFPILIKAAAGGGGKGMHIVRDEREFAAAFALAESEAERYFADRRVYCEKYLERPRHIEVQILADEHGRCVHLGERDCSVQRRFQKVVEESPAPGLGDELRRRICQTAVDIARTAGYTNAGTVEFIMDADGTFYFLEMNTRLQVEHPVTEMTTGIDLVEAQLSVAAGAPLAFAQSDIVHRGHAIECRICAEDTDADFMPATGRVVLVRDASGDGVRVDSGLVEGTTVTAAFDPMLAKLIVHGKDRDEAIAKACAALAEQLVLGVTTNIGFLCRVLQHPAFAAATVHTHFIDQHAAALRRPEPSMHTAHALLCIAALNEPAFRRQLFDVAEPHASMGAWRNA